MGKELKTKRPQLQLKAKVTEVEGERRIVFVASSNGEDRDYENVIVDSLRLPLKGGGFVKASDLTGGEAIDIPLLLNHSFDVEDVIGSVRKAYLNESGELVFEAGIASRAKAQDMLSLLEEDHLSNAFSITMIDFDYNFDSGTISNAEIAEVSLVFRGSNKEARLLQVKSLLKGEQMSDKKDKQTALAEKEEKLKTLQEEIEADKAAIAKDAEDSADDSADSADDVVDDTTDDADDTSDVDDADEADDTDENDSEDDSDEDESDDAEEDDDSEEDDSEEDDSDTSTKDAKETKSMSDKKDKSVAADTIEKAPKPSQSQSEKAFDKIDFTAKQFVAFVTKDHKTLAELNKQAIESYGAISKETYMNTEVLADGGAIVPTAQLLEEVYTLLGQYSTVAQDLRVITLTSGDSIEIATLVQDVIVSEVAEEGGDKEVTKPVLGQPDLSLREFAGIAIITKKLVRQAAVNVYNLLRDSFARAIAKKRAQMALTDSSSGIVNQSGVATVETAGELPTYQEIKKAPYRVPVAAVSGAKYYISREALESLDSEVDGEGRDLDIVELDGEDGLTGRFKNGFRFAVEEELGKDGNPHVVFGAMGRFGILLRQGTVESETFDTGIVVDNSEVEHNLLQQNKLAHRVAFYENVGYPLPGAFAVFEEASS